MPAEVENVLAIVLEGGIVQGLVASDEALVRELHRLFDRIVVIDYDTEGSDERELSYVEQGDGTKFVAYVRDENASLAKINLHRFDPVRVVKLPPLADIRAKGLAALDLEMLQCQQPGFVGDADSCVYSGPCIIGVVISPEDRAYLDEGGEPTPIRDFLQNGTVIPSPDTPAEWLIELQSAHDHNDQEALRQLLVKGPGE